MKTRDFKKAADEEPAWYASAARPSTPGELTRVPPAELAETEPDAASAESEESADSSKNKAKQRWFAGLYAAIAAFSFVTGQEELYVMLLVACAFLAALEGETRWRVPKLVKICASVLVVVLSIMMFVLMILKSRGR